MSVLLSDLAGKIGRPVEVAVSLLDRVWATVTEDPLGRLIVSDDDARKAVEMSETKGV